MLTNFSAIVWQQIFFVPLLLIRFLSSIKTIVPIVVNTSLRTRTQATQLQVRGRWEIIYCKINYSCRPFPAFSS